MREKMWQSTNRGARRVPRAANVGSRRSPNRAQYRSPSLVSRGQFSTTRATTSEKWHRVTLNWVLWCYYLRMFAEQACWWISPKCEPCVNWMSCWPVTSTAKYCCWTFYNRDCSIGKHGRCEMFRPPTIGAPAAAGGPIIDFSAKGGRKQPAPRTHARNVVTLKAMINPHVHAIPNTFLVAVNSRR